MRKTAEVSLRDKADNILLLKEREDEQVHKTRYHEIGGGRGY